MNHCDKGQLDLKKLDLDLQILIINYPVIGELLPLSYYKILTIHHLFVQGKIFGFMDQLNV